MTLKLVSWNIDSLNAALVGTSTRAVLTQKVLDTIAGLDPEIIALQETKLSCDGPTKKHYEVMKQVPGQDRLEQFCRTGTQG